MDFAVQKGETHSFSQYVRLLIGKPWLKRIGNHKLMIESGRYDQNRERLDLVYKLYFLQIGLKTNFTLSSLVLSILL